MDLKKSGKTKRRLEIGVNIPNLHLYTKTFILPHLPTTKTLLAATRFNPYYEIEKYELLICRLAIQKSIF